MEHGKQRYQSNLQRGNALFLILIAVALFAALSYAITQSSRGGGAGISKETAVLQAAQVMSVTESVRQGVQRFMLLSNVAADAIVSGSPANACCAGQGSANTWADFCTTGATCLFSPEGGGVTPPSLPLSFFDTGNTAGLALWEGGTVFTGPNAATGFEFDGFSPGAIPPWVAVSGIGTAATDHLLEVYPLKQEICAAINAGLGISGIPVIAAGTPLFDGAVTGKHEACINMTDGSARLYMYYVVLAAR